LINKEKFDKDVLRMMEDGRYTCATKCNREKCGAWEYCILDNRAVPNVVKVTFT